MNATEAVDIAFVIWSMDSGGAQRVAARLANSWSRTHRVTIVTLEPDTDDFYRLDSSIRRIRLALRPSRRVFSKTRNYIGHIRQIRQTLKKLSPTVVVSFMDRTNNQVLLASRRLQLPVIISERTDPRHHSINIQARLIRRIAYPFADALVVQTHSVKGWARTLVAPSRIRVIPNPVAPCGTNSKLPRANKIVAVGRLVEIKGFDTLIRAFALVALKYPEWTLEILGEGPQRTALAALAQELDVAHRVSMPGVVQNVDSHLSSSSVFVLSSIFEGFPNALLEAMACGTACITTDYPSRPGDIIEPRVDALLVPVGDSHAMSSALESLMSDSRRRASLGLAAQNSVKRYAPENVLPLWEDALQTAIARRSRRRDRR